MTHPPPGLTPSPPPPYTPLQHHPIYNFIFQYYHFDARSLVHFSPGLADRPLLLDGAMPGDPRLPRRGFRFVRVEGGGQGALLWPEPSQVRIWKREHGTAWCCSEGHDAFIHAPSKIKLEYVRQPVLAGLVG
jgi:hypothetical protein